MATGKSGSSAITGGLGMGVKIYWSETYDIISNKSAVTIDPKMTCTGYGGGYRYWLTGTFSINGTDVVTMDSVKGTHHSYCVYGSETDIKASGSYSPPPWTLTDIAHNSDGSKSIEIAVNIRGYTTDGSGASGFAVSGSFTIDLTSIDRAAPTVSLSISNITTDGFKISASSSVTADVWSYSLDGGSSYTQFSTTAGTSASVTVSGLTPNTSYNVRVRARKQLNQVYGYSSTVAAKTLGASVINSTTSFAADVASPSLPYNLTVYDSGYYHQLSFKNGSTVIFTAKIGKLSAGTSARTFSLTSAQRQALLDAFPSSTSLTVTVEITTYADSGYSTQVGSASSKTVSATTSSAVSAPDFPGFTYCDSKTSVVNVTGNDQILVKTLSALQVTCEAGTAKNGATIKSYSASIANASITSTGNTISVGAITSYGDLLLIVTCTDSRGYASKVEKTVKVLNYASPKLSSHKLRRKDEIEGLVQLSFSGTISAIKADGTNDTNGLTYVRYRYKKTSEDTYSSYVSILADVSISGTSFSFASLELIELDTESSYDFHLQIRDKFGSTTSLDLYEVLPQGTPVVSLRKRDSAYNYPRVGVNNPTPKHPLDVAGSIAMNGFLILGYVKDLSSENFNTLKEGIYFYPGAGCSNAPVSAPGFLEAITNGTYILHRFTTLAGAVYNRGYDGSSWSAWA